MAEAIIAGPAIEFAFELLFGTVKSTIRKAVIYKEMFNKINTTLEALAPLIKQIKVSNEALDRPKSETSSFELVLQRGQKLVSEYPKVSKWWNLYKRPHYSSKLQELDESLDRLLKILVAYQTRDLQEILLLQRENMAKIAKTQKSNSVHGEIEVNMGLCAPPVPPAFTVGLDVPLKELKMKLLEDDVSVLVLTASPGCGKTTLAKKLCQDDKIREKFKSNIMFVKVSRTPNLNLLVQELYQHNGRKVPSFRDEEDALNWLGRLLKEIGQSPLLLVLDDVWSGSESLIEKFNSFEIPQFKILVTSRSAFPGFGAKYELKLLSDEDAMTLFRRAALLENSSIKIPEDLVTKVVQYCKRVPLALKLIGSSLRGRRAEIWQCELEKWSEGSSVLSSDAELLACLQSSLDVLDEKDIILKDCFTDLGSFPEDQRIPATALIDMWAELYELKELYAAANLFELSDRNLANVLITRRDVDEKDGYYSEHFITQHDMLRELAIHQTKQDPGRKRKRLIMQLHGGNFPKWWDEQNDQPFNARLLAISTDDYFSSKCCNINLPAVEALVLNFQTKNYVLPEFVNNMSKLKVLIITNYSFFPAELSNIQLLGSLNKLKRIRLERIAIASLSETPTVLKNLQKLSLFMCKIGEAFSSVKISELLPNLVEMDIDYCNDLVELPAGLCEIINLKKLSITHCHKLCSLSEEIGNLINLEVLRLRSCIDLEKLPDSICKLLKLNFLDISDCFSIRNLPESIGELHSLTKLNMRNCSRLQELPPSVLDFRHLKDVVCDEELKELWESFLPCPTNIKLSLAKDEINLNWL